LKNQNGESLSHQSQSGGAAAEGVSVQDARSFHRKEGEDVILSPRPADWSDYLAHAPVASPGFMEDVEELPVQERR